MIADRGNVRGAGAGPRARRRRTRDHIQRYARSSARDRPRPTAAAAQHAHLHLRRDVCDAPGLLPIKAVRRADIGDFGGELRQRGRGRVYTQGCEAAAQRAMNVGGGVVPGGRGPSCAARPRHSRVVAVSPVAPRPSGRVPGAAGRARLRRRGSGAGCGRRGVHGVCSCTDLPHVEPRSSHDSSPTDLHAKTRLG